MGIKNVLGHWDEDQTPHVVTVRTNHKHNFDKFKIQKKLF